MIRRSFNLKFVVSSEADLLEIDQILTQLTGWHPSDVLLMPEGTDIATLNFIRARRVDRRNLQAHGGYRYCPRLHVELYGNTRGT